MDGWKENAMFHEIKSLANYRFKSFALMPNYIADNRKIMNFTTQIQAEIQWKRRREIRLNRASNVALVDAD